VLVTAAYGLIALGRAWFLESRGLNATWLAASPRYHYLASIGLIACLALGAGGLWRRGDAVFGSSTRRWLPVLLAGGWLVGVLPLAQTAARRTDGQLTAWSREVFRDTRARMRELIVQAPPGEPVFIQNRPFLGTAFIQRFLSPGAFPGWAAVFVLTYPDDVVEGRRVYFVEGDPRVLAAVRARSGRVVRLLVAPAEAPQGRRPRDEPGIGTVPTDRSDHASTRDAPIGGPAA
jgi:hypothetical protein